MKCVFSWQPETPLLNFFIRELNDLYDLTFVDKEDLNTLEEALKEADALVGWVMNEALLSKADQLRYIFYPGAGVQHISKDLIAMFQQKEIIFSNSHSNAYATAQHACALLLTLCNKVVTHHQYLKDGKWRTGDKEGKSISLRQKRIGLLGFGAIGQHIYKMLQGFECQFLVYKNNRQIDEGFKNKVELFSSKAGSNNSLIDFLKSSDIIICSLPQTSQTINLLNENNLKYLNPHALLINIGRGSVIEEAALYHLLVEKRIAGAAIDVWYNYKPEPSKEDKKYPFNFPFEQLSQIVLSPHRGASPMDDPYRFEDVIYNLHEIVKPYPQLKNVINFDLGY